MGLPTLSMTCLWEVSEAFKPPRTVFLDFPMGCPAGKPHEPELQREIANAVIEVVKMPDVQAKFRTVAVEPIGGTPAEMAAYVKEESQRWGEVIRKNNIVVD